MNLVDTAVLFLSGYVVVILAAALLMTLKPGVGTGPLYLGDPVPAPGGQAEAALRLRQREGVMPTRAWGFKPPVQHSHYEPATWQVRPPRSDADGLANVDRATDIKRKLGSEHEPWERLDRQGL